MSEMVIWFTDLLIYNDQILVVNSATLCDTVKDINSFIHILLTDRSYIVKNSWYKIYILYIIYLALTTAPNLLFELTQGENETGWMDPLQRIGTTNVKLS